MMTWILAAVPMALGDPPGDPPDADTAEPPDDEPGVQPKLILEPPRLGGQNIQVFTIQRTSMAKLLGIEAIPDDLDGVTISQELREVVSRLAEESYEARVRATAELVDLSCPDNELYAVLDREQLSGEQRWRVLAAIRERLASRPSGAMGIRFSRLLDEAIIDQVIPGMPAERVLRGGDHITHINGQPIAGRNDLVAHVQRRPPGSIITLTVQRPRRDEQGLPLIAGPGEQAFDEVDIELELGSFAELDRISRELGEGPVPPSAVQRERLSLADAAAQRFAPKPRPIEIAGGLPPELRDGNAAPQGFGDIEDYPPLQTLLTQRRYIEQGMLTITPALQRQWEAHIQLMRDRIMSDTLDRAERDYLIRVFARYRDVVGDLLGK